MVYIVLFLWANLPTIHLNQVHMTPHQLTNTLPLARLQKSVMLCCLFLAVTVFLNVPIRETMNKLLKWKMWRFSVMLQLCKTQLLAFQVQQYVTFIDWTTSLPKFPLPLIFSYVPHQVGNATWHFAVCFQDFLLAALPHSYRTVPIRDCWPDRGAWHVAKVPIWTEYVCFENHKWWTAAPCVSEHRPPPVYVQHILNFTVIVQLVFPAVVLKERFLSGLYFSAICLTLTSWRYI